MSAITDATTLSELKATLRKDPWVNEVCFLGPAYLPNPDYFLSAEELTHMFQLCEAIWWYQKPISAERPHTTMRSGDHTDFFVNCMDVMKESALLTVLAYQVVMRCADHARHMNANDWVVGAERAGAPIAQEVARILGCRYATVEKDREDKLTVFNRFQIAAGERVFLVNDLLSHPDGSTYMSKVVVQKSCPEAVILPVAMHLANRSGAVNLVDGTPVRSLLDYGAREYPADDCELCRGGSPVLRFKTNKPLFLAK